jgi:cell division protein FtsZ
VNVNSFIETKKEEEPVSTEPVLITKEESQVDLFAGYFQKSQVKAEEVKPVAKQEPIIRHTLVDQEEQGLQAPLFELDIKPQVDRTELPVYEEPAVAQKPAEPDYQAPAPVTNPDENRTDESIEEQLRKSKERILRLKDLSMKLRTSNGLQELENEPAYKRKQMSLQQVPHSSESQVSRFTLSTEEGITEIRPNNSFLHDNVD